MQKPNSPAIEACICCGIAPPVACAGVLDVVAFGAAVPVTMEAVSVSELRALCRAERDVQVTLATGTDDVEKTDCVVDDGWSAARTAVAAPTATRHRVTRIAGRTIGSVASSSEKGESSSASGAWCCWYRTRRLDENGDSQFNASQPRFESVFRPKTSKVARGAKMMFKLKQAKEAKTPAASAWAAGSDGERRLRCSQNKQTGLSTRWQKREL